MRLLEKKILTDGKVLDGGILKVDNFLNHQMDVNLLSLLAKEVYEKYKDKQINKILTVEASGIGLACFVAQLFNCPLLVAKKSKSLNISDDVYCAKVYSFTHKKTPLYFGNQLFISAFELNILMQKHSNNYIIHSI